MKKIETERFIYLIKQNNKLKEKVRNLESIILKAESNQIILSVEEALKEFNMSRSTFDRLRKRE